MSRRNLERHIRDPVRHPFGYAAKYRAACLQRRDVGRERKPVEFLGQLGLSQEISKRRADVIDFPERCFPRLRLARNIEISVFRVGEKELLPGLMLFPSHASGLLQPESAALAAKRAWTLLNLDKGTLQAGETVIVLVDCAGCRRSIHGLPRARQTAQKADHRQRQRMMKNKTKSMVYDSGPFRNLTFCL